jgi:O-antigen/teichoic acid export membrane protein
MNKKTQLAKNTFIISIGKFSSQLISFMLLPLYTLYLNPVDYGLVDLILTYVALLAPIVTIQMEMASFRFLIDARDDERQKSLVISNALQIVLGASVALTALCLVLGQFVNIPYFPLIVVNIFAAILVNLFLQFARGLGDNRRFAIGSTVIGIATLAATAAFVVYARDGAAGVLVSLIAANLIATLYLFWSLELYKYISLFHGNKALKRRLLHYSLPLVPNGLSWWAISVSDRTIISIALGLAANGIYAVSAKYAAIFSSLFFIFSLAFTEAASVHINAKDRDAFLSETNSASLKLFGSLGLLLIAACPFVFMWFIGPEFQEASQYIPVLIVAAFFNAVVGIYSAIYVAKKMTKQVANTSIAAAVINVVLTVGLIHFLGIWAAALATALAYLAMAIFRHYDLRKLVNITYEKGLLLKIGVAYTVVIVLFYFNTLAGSILNVLIATVIASLLNKSILILVKDGILNARYLIKAR